MEKERNHGKKYFILNRIKFYLSSQEKTEAYLLDYMREHPELTPKPPSPPPGEFEKIMEELNRRGRETMVRRQLKVLYYGRRFINSLQKPLLVAMVILILLATSAIAASAKKAHDYQWRQQYTDENRDEVLKVDMMDSQHVHGTDW